MGVKGLNSYITRNIRPSYKYWKLNKTIYKSLTCEDFQKCELPKKIKNENNAVTLVIDGHSFFYSFANKLNWFIYDNLNLIEMLQKQLLFFLSIENLKKIIFVFDGVDIPLKGETEFLRRNDKIESMKQFCDYIIHAEKLQDKNSPKTITPSPLSKMTFFQFLLDSEKIFNKIELKFSLLEADKYIAELANKYNGYVISNDSDFFIYKTPGFINLKSLEFPKSFVENSNDKYDFIINYELYTNKQVLSHFNLTYDTLPIFASLCSNDYLKIDNYPQLKQYFKYHKGNRRKTNSINFHIYKNIVNFILDAQDSVNSTEKSTLTEYKDLTDLQKLIIEKIASKKPKESNEEIENNFKITLINSVRQYTLSSEIKDVNEKYCMGNFDDSLKSNILSLNKNILDSLYSGYFYSQIMNVLIKYQFECSPYFENINMCSCWDITQDIRKKMYELIISRNNNQKVIDQIEEQSRNGVNAILKNVPINPLNNENIFTDSVESNFIKYLDIFNSNEASVKDLPYYLIPIVSCLRFFLKKKLEMNSFIYKYNDKTYSHLVNNINYESTNSGIMTQLHYYELEALIASSIAAMSFTFLSCCNSQNVDDDTLTSEFSIINNINQNKNIDGYYDNMYIQYIKNQSRNLQLKDDFSVNNLRKNKNLFENVIQIYAEFRSILIMNTYLLQTLRIIDDLPEFKAFFSMYHYQWEEAYYSMVDFFRINRDKKISFIFDHLYSMKESGKQKRHYIEYLENVYSAMLNAIISN